VAGSGTWLGHGTWPLPSSQSQGSAALRCSIAEGLHAHKEAFVTVLLSQPSTCPQWCNWTAYLYILYSILILYLQQQASSQAKNINPANCLVPLSTTACSLHKLQPYGLHMQAVSKHPIV
jgi:hypothetical protein